MEYTLLTIPTLLPIDCKQIFQCCFKSLDKVLDHVKDENNLRMVDNQLGLKPIPKEYTKLYILNWCNGGLYSAYLAK